jgi:Tfp pilus assembly protein PilW
MLGMAVAADRSGVRRPLPRPVHATDGYALPELLAAIVIGLVVVGLPLTLAVNAYVQQNAASSRSVSTTSAAQALDRLVRDLRQATAATISQSGDSATAVLSVPVRQAVGVTTPPTVQVTWTCTAGSTCTRATAGGRTEHLLRGVQRASFAPVSRSGAPAVPQTNPAYVGVTIVARIVSELDARGGSPPGVRRPITLQEGVVLRNFA